jgi:hypothetical protein
MPTRIWRPGHDPHHAAAAGGGLPLPRPADDPRFTYRLVFDIADGLATHGDPRPAHTDWADLMPALFRFLYQPNPQEPNP